MLKLANRLVEDVDASIAGSGVRPAGKWRRGPATLLKWPNTNAILDSLVKKL